MICYNNTFRTVFMVNENSSLSIQVGILKIINKAFRKELYILGVGEEAHTD